LNPKKVGVVTGCAVLSALGVGILGFEFAASMATVGAVSTYSAIIFDAWSDDSVLRKKYEEFRSSLKTRAIVSLALAGSAASFSILKTHNCAQKAAACSMVLEWAAFFFAGGSVVSLCSTAYTAASFFLTHSRGK
jgi:hypothetical protein